MKLSTILVTFAIAILTMVGCGASTADKIRSSLIHITIQVPGIGEESCTGFVVRPKIVLTAAHCIGPLMQGDGYEATLIQKDEYFDLAVLRIPLTNKIPLTLRTDPIVINENLLAIGYAWGWSFPVATPQTVIGRAIKPNPRTPAGIIVTPGYYHGMSGGPVVDVLGEVVGIVQQTFEGAGYGVGIEIINAFLLDAGVL